MQNRHEPILSLRSLLQSVACAAWSVIGVSISASVSLAAGLGELSSFQATGYLPYYRGSAINQINYDYLTDVVYFSISPTSTGAIDSTNVVGADLASLSTIAGQNGVDVHIAVGGAGLSGGFPDIVIDPVKRQAFATNLTSYVQANNLAGANLNWEGPANSTEIDGYSDLINDIQTAFSPHGLELTIALPGWGPQINSSAHAALDNLFIMSYDGGTPHSPFSLMVDGIAFWRTQGMPDAQLSAGMPFYGRNSANNALTYAQIMTTYSPAPDEDEAGGYHFNGTETIMQKAQYAAEQGLSGIMFWELGQDTTDDTSLLRAAYAGVMMGEGIADVNLDGALDGADWTQFLAGAGQDLGGMTMLDRFQMGDLNGDGENDHGDFVIFKKGYQALNGADSFGDFIAPAPEPGTMVLGLLSLVSVLLVRFRRLSTCGW